MIHVKIFVLGLLLTLSVSVQTTTAQFLPTDARALNEPRVPFLFATNDPKTIPLVEQVGAIGMTVSDMATMARALARVIKLGGRDW